VQETIEKAISNLLTEKTNLTGAGRTDTGVHASYFVAHFDCTELKDPKLLLNKLNRYLGSSILIFNIKSAENSHHARFDAISRTYKYVLSKNKQPFLDNLSYHYHRKLDLKALNEASSILLGTRDFSSFAKLHGGNKTNLCLVSIAEWSESGDYLIFTIKADRFLRNMVRSVTGTLLDVGKLKIDVAEFQKIIDSKNNQNASASAPPQALYLFDIEYPVEYGLVNPVLQSEFPFTW
jgi:tRNA pseudouridine38-40 synthase